MPPSRNRRSRYNATVATSRPPSAPQLSAPQAVQAPPPVPGADLEERLASTVTLRVMEHLAPILRGVPAEEPTSAQLPAARCSVGPAAATPMGLCFAGPSMSSTSSQAGELVNSTCPNPVAIAGGITPLAVPLGAHVQEGARQKLWQNQFVELRTLLVQTDLEEERNAAGKTKSAPEPFRMHDYITAFHTLMAIRVQRFPNDAAPLLKHLETVRELAASYGNEAASRYDRQFRFALAHDPMRSWGAVDTQLYMQAAAAGLRLLSTQQKQSGLARGQGNRSPTFNQELLRPETCWSFQLNDGVCKKQNCKFKSTHACYDCGGAHATQRCPGVASSGEQTERSANKPFRRGGSGQTDADNAPQSEASIKRR